ncbi:MAG: acetyl-CoA C-acyltransferase [Acidimicrobiales bacterium]|nr:MAG: acetyl-CoA C-acyltransferase [Acidimicrobiales bacterium]
MTNSADDVVIIEGARTPIGRFNGSLSGFTATDIGGMAIAGALEASGVAAESVDKVVMGHVLTAGEGQSAARNAAVKGGIPLPVDAVTINKVCLSGLQAINYASMMLQTGQAEVVVAGGMESMSGSPHLLMKSRTGYGYGDGALVDSLQFDGLTCAVENKIMGEATDVYAMAATIDRDAQDAYAAQSHDRAARAIKDGILDSETITVSVPQRKSDPIEFTADEGVRAGTDAASLAKLRAAFNADGAITAGNASQLSDGASAMVVTTRAKAEELGVEPLATVLGYGMVAGPDNCSLLHQPSRAIQTAAERSGVATGDIDLYEINEAFAAVALASMDELGVSDEIVNVNGGAIAVGHPLGMSGNRIALTLAHELRRRGGGIGAAGLCGGGGQGDAMIIHVP